MMKHTLIAAASLLTAATAIAQETGTADPSLIKKGEYLARAGDCIACHTAPDGKPFAGGLGIGSPIGTIYSTNITPDKETGIGNYSYDDFERAVRHGVTKDGHTLYPAMPYTDYAKVSPADIKALYAYFMHGVEPVRQANKKEDITWPLSMRWPLTVWRHVYAPDEKQDTAASTSSPAMRGRYLVEGLGHCGECHTPRGIALQQQAMDESDGKAFLSGAVADNWLAKNLHADNASGLLGWSEQDIVDFLKTGRNSHSAAFGGMADVVSQSTQYMSDEDLHAIAAYLKTLEPLETNRVPLSYDNTVSKALRKGTDISEGGRIFLDNCAACHRSSGLGYDETFPHLALSSTVNTEDATSIVHLILKGAKMPATRAAPTQFAMPNLDWRLTDGEIAEVVNFIRSSWGNKAKPIQAADVTRLRKEVNAEPQPQRD